MRIGGSWCGTRNPILKPYPGLALQKAFDSIIGVQIFWVEANHQPWSVIGRDGPWVTLVPRHETWKGKSLEETVRNHENPDEAKGGRL